MATTREAGEVHKLLNPHDVQTPVRLAKFTRKGLARLFHTLGYKRGAEIGVESGRYSRQICEQVPGVHLTCVDAWVSYKGYKRNLDTAAMQVLHQRAIERLAPHNVHFIHDFSMNAVQNVRPEFLDFVYIDGNHAFDYVMQDIIEWSKRVRPGGIVAGHDYYHFRGAGVVEAVNAYTAAHGISEWYLTCGTHRGKSKSWFWVKNV